MALIANDRSVRPDRRWRRTAAGLLVAAVMLALAVWRFESHLDGPVNIDEVYWVGSAYYYELAIHRVALLHPDWQLMPARENPPIGKYLIGAALAAGGHRVEGPDRLAIFLLHFADQPGAWGEGASFAKRRAVVDRLDPDVWLESRRRGGWGLDPGEVRAGRIAVLAFGVLATAGTIACGWLLGGPLTGLLAGLVVAIHPLTLMAATVVSVDAMALACSTWAMAALLAMLGRTGPVAPIGPGRSAMLAVAFGVMLAMACGSKMNAATTALTAALIWAGLLIDAGRRPSSRGRVPLRGLSLGIALSFVLFVLSDPTLYPDPIGGLIALIRENHISAGIQAEFLDGFLETAPERLLALADLIGRRWWIGVLLLASAGLTTLRGLRSGDSRTLAVCIWWWVTLLAVGAWLPFAWPRYALPLLPPTAVVVASTAVGLLGRKVDRR